MKVNENKQALRHERRNHGGSDTSTLIWIGTRYQATKRFATTRGEIPPRFGIILHSSRAVIMMLVRGATLALAYLSATHGFVMNLSRGPGEGSMSRRQAISKLTFLTGASGIAVEQLL